MNTQSQLNELIASGYTQTIIAESTKVSQATISRIASGLHADIKASTASAINTLYETEKTT